jgi:hypothetical protein
MLYNSRRNNCKDPKFLLTLIALIYKTYKTTSSVAFTLDKNINLTFCVATWIWMWTFCLRLFSGLEITVDHQSMICKKLLMIGGIAGFWTWKSFDCRSSWSGTLGMLFQALCFACLFEVGSLKWNCLEIFWWAVYIDFYNIAFVNSERWLAKSHVDITQCQHGNVGKFLSLCFFVLYYKTNIKHFFGIDIQLYQHSWKLGKLEIVWHLIPVFPISTRVDI